MAYERSDFNGSDLTHCACGAAHRPGYRLIECSREGCDAVGCFECFAECECSSSCGRFCEAHLNLAEGLMACYRCESEILDESELTTQGSVN